MSNRRRDARPTGPRADRRRPAALSAAAGGGGPARRWAAPAAAGGLALLVLLVFGQVLRYGFVSWDDPDAIVHNPDYNPPDAGRLWHYWADWRTGYRSFYVPVLYTVWGAAAHLSYDPAGPDNPAVSDTARLDPGLFHALNLIAHLGSALAAFAVLRRLTGRVGPAFVGAAVFAVHPVQAEAASWASTLYTPLSVAFGLAGVRQFLAAADRLPGQPGVAGDAAAGGSAPTGETSPGGTPAGGTPAGGTPAGGRWLAVPGPAAWARYAIATALFVLSLLTKPSLVLLPGVVAAAELLLVRRPPPARRSAVLALFPWVALAVAAAWLARATQPAPFVVKLPLWDRVLVAGDTFAFYLRKLAVPTGLVAEYGRSPQWVLANAPAGLWLAASAALSVGCAALYRRAPWATVGWLAYGAGVSVTLGLVPFEYQRYSTTADRYAYFATFGLGLVAAFAVAKLTDPRGGDGGGGGGGGGRDEQGPLTRARRRQRARVVWGVAGVWVAVLAAAAAAQSATWRDSLAMGSHALSVNPGSRVGGAALMGWHAERGRPAEAAGYGLRVVSEHPYDALVQHYLGHVLMRLRRWDEAADHFAAAAQYAEMPDARADAYNALGVARAQAGRAGEAEAAFRESVRQDPTKAAGHRSLATLYLNAGRLDEAVAEFRAGLALDPANPVLQRAVADLSAEQARRAATRPAP